MQLNSVKESLQMTVACDSRDWSSDKRDAWIYGIVLGWCEAAMVEIALKFNWSKEDVERLNKLYKEFDERY